MARVNIKWEDYLGREDLLTATDADLSDLEARVGKTLPQSLKELMAEHGGQKPINLRPVDPNGMPMSIPCIYHAFPDDDEFEGYSPLDPQSLLEEDGFVDLIPFADKGTVYLCLDYSKSPTQPSVAMVFREFEPEDPDHKYELASDFDEFLERFTVSPDQITE